MSDEKPKPANIAAVAENVIHNKTYVLSDRAKGIIRETRKIPEDLFPFQEAASLIDRIDSISKRAYQQWGVDLQAGILNFSAEVSYDLMQNDSPEKIEMLQRFRRSFGALRFDHTIKKRDATYLIFDLGSSKLTVMLLLTESGAITRDSYGTIEFKLKSSQDVAEFTSFIQNYGPNGLTALFGLIFSPEITPENNIRGASSLPGWRSSFIIPTIINKDGQSSNTRYHRVEALPEISFQKPVEESRSENEEWVSINDL